MFSHVMVGSNDLERSQKFYDALFGDRRKPGRQDDKGRLSYGRNGAVLMVTLADRRRSRRPRQWFDHRLHLRQPGGGRRLARGRRRGRRHVDRRPARHPPR